MAGSTATFIVGVLGIIGTAVSGGIGHYFVYRARKGAYQAALFNEQMAVIKKAAVCVGRVRHFIPWIITDNLFRSQVEQDLHDALADLDKIVSEASVVLPVDVWKELSGFSGEAADILHRDRPDRSKHEAELCVARAGAFLVAARKFMGIDTVSVETYQLLTGSKEADIVPEKFRDELLANSRRES